MTYTTITVDNGTGTDYGVVVDTIAGVGNVQVHKLGVGAEDAFTPLAFGQATMANSLPVVIASNQGDVPVALNAASLAALESITVGGTVELGATSLAALESITIVDGGSTISVDDGGGTLTVDGTVELGATTLAALESITVADGGGSLTVDGTVELGATTLAALESITVVDGGGSLTVDGTVELGATTLAALETTTAIVGGTDAHDAAITANPVTVGGRASAAAPTDVSADGDAVRAWFLRNGAQATVLTAAGALIGGDATNGIDVDVTRIIPGTGATNLGKAEDAAAASGDTGVMHLGVRNDNGGSAFTSANGDYSAVAVDQVGRTLVSTSSVTATTTITRPADTTAYAADDTWADSTSAPTAGGFSLASVAQFATSGAGGMITDIVVISSNNPTTKLQGELWIFDSAVTAVNDNAAFTLTDADALKLVAIVPFTLNQYGDSAAGGNSMAHLQGLNIGYNVSGAVSALRFLVKVKNAYTPASAEALTVRAKCIRY